VAVRGRLRPRSGLPPRGNRAVVGVAGTIVVAALVATALATGAALPAGRVFTLTLVGLVGGLAMLTVARSGRVGGAGPGAAIAGLALAGIAARVAFTTYYLAEYPMHHRVHPPATLSSLPPVTAVVLAVVLAGCLWLALRPPRWLLPDRHARRLGIAMAIALVAGFVLVSRLEQRDIALDAGVMSYLLYGPIMVILTGSAAAAALGRSFRSGALGLRMGHRAGRAADHRRVAGRGAALVSAGSRDAPGRRRRGRGGRQPGRCDLVAPGAPGAVGPTPGGARRGRRGARARRQRAREHADLTTTA
jgi:hypothetical protein